MHWQHIVASSTILAVAHVEEMAGGNVDIDLYAGVDELDPELNQVMFPLILPFSVSSYRIALERKRSRSSQCTELSN